MEYGKNCLREFGSKVICIYGIYKCGYWGILILDMLIFI